MQKIYKSLSFLSFNVKLGKETVNDNGRVYERDATKRIVFEPDSTGYAYYTADDETLQNAMEKHPFFNKMFVLKDAPVVTEKKVNPFKSKKKKEEVEVASASDAKQYLVEKFEISRTQIQTTSDIKRFAEQNGIVFIGI